MAKVRPVIFWGKSSEYGKCAGWPKGADLVLVAERLQEDPNTFLAEMQVAEWGLYFLEADDDKDL